METVYRIFEVEDNVLIVPQRDWKAEFPDFETKEKAIEYLAGKSKKEIGAREFVILQVIVG